MHALTALSIVARNVLSYLLLFLGVYLDKLKSRPSSSALRIKIKINLNGAKP